eukprot:TRINITY_DN5555_c0_g1_i1.p1 TRINITY_DN5555_c0_g1~~TRINITY_DN5555_c0_g1_i1.p1  ORF type:complete len:147 (+),score=14.05 TRINITY_DN5555_c0_g1_i1:61-501(+)
MPSHIGDVTSTRAIPRLITLCCQKCGVVSRDGSTEIFSDRQVKKARKHRLVFCRECANTIRKDAQLASRHSDGTLAIGSATIARVLDRFPSLVQARVVACLRPPAPIQRLEGRFYCPLCDRHFLRTDDAAQHCSAKHSSLSATPSI